MSWPRQGSQRTLEVPKFEFASWISLGLGLRMPREAWRLPSPQMLQTFSAVAKATKAVRRPADGDDAKTAGVR